MKLFKQLLCAALALFTVACTTDEEPATTPTDGSYSGVLTVVSPAGDTTETDGISFDVEIDSDASTLTLTLNAVSFNTNMPALTMYVEDVPYTESNGVITVDTTDVVPYIGGLPYDQYTFSTFYCSLSSEVMAVNLSCASYTISFAGARD